MKYYIIIVICVILLFIIKYETFDISANLNLLNDAYSPKLLNEKRIPMTMFPPEVEDNEIPNQIDFDKTVTITHLQKLKSLNNILDRVKEVNPPKLFNSALLPMTKFEVDTDSIRFINNYLNNQIMYYSGDQYTLVFKDVSNLSADETDTQFKIYYIQTCIVDNLKINIIIDVVIDKPDMNNNTPVVSFNELRIDNPSIYITPNAYKDNHALISSYS
jgi:hypothetical protein